MMRTGVFGSARHGRLATSLATGAAIAVSGCGSAAPTKHPAAAHHRAAAPTLCEAKVLDVISQFLKVPAAKITNRQSVGNDAEPQCTFVTHVAGGRRVSVTANVGVEVGAYFILERTQVEASQMFAPTRLSPAPQAVPRLGLEADWFPAETHLMATDGTRLVTTTVTWRGAGQGRKTALATVVTRPYLKTPHGKAAIAKAEGYPAG